MQARCFNNNNYDDLLQTHGPYRRYSKKMSLMGVNLVCSMDEALLSLGLVSGP